MSVVGAVEYLPDVCFLRETSPWIALHEMVLALTKGQIMNYRSFWSGTKVCSFQMCCVRERCTVLIPSKTLVVPLIR